MIGSAAQEEKGSLFMASDTILGGLVEFIIVGLHLAVAVVRPES